MDEVAAAALPVRPKNPVDHHDHHRKAPPGHGPQATSLVEMCRSVITTNLERYPPESFAICDPEEWEAIVSLRHLRTQPKKAIASATSTTATSSSSGGGGGLDGSGRLVPAVAEKFLLEFEEKNPHLAECKVTDELLWKDCVEYRFRRGGLTRPVALHLPWPLLVEELQCEANTLSSTTLPVPVLHQAIAALRRSPMNVSLLKDSGVGKTVKKAIKKAVGLDAESKRELEDLLATWMKMAANNGVGQLEEESPSKSPFKQDDSSSEHLKLAETCQSWRQLFAALQHKNEEIRTTQGKRMREKRRNLAKTRPKLVKVRPTTDQQQRVLDRSPSRGSGNVNVAKLRKEATIVVRPKASFGDAVAFASTSKKGAAHKRKQLGGTLHQLGAGKRMKVPTEVTKGAGPRGFASKWKNTK